jgi:hypothetical protein
MKVFLIIVLTTLYLSVLVLLLEKAIDAAWEVQNDWKEWVLAKSWVVGFIFWISIPIGYGLSQIH